jgi:hypothetical protein
MEEEKQTIIQKQDISELKIQNEQFSLNGIEKTSHLDIKKKKK